MQKTLNIEVDIVVTDAANLESQALRVKGVLITPDDLAEVADRIQRSVTVELGGDADD